LLAQAITTVARRSATTVVALSTFRLANKKLAVVTMSNVRTKLLASCRTVGEFCRPENKYLGKKKKTNRNTKRIQAALNASSSGKGSAQEIE
jgi:hypothetical protein